MFTREEFRALKFEERKQVMEWRAKFHAKKAKATAAVERIKKTGWNDFHKYWYATESDIKDGIRPLLEEFGLSFTSDLLKRVETTVKTNKGEATKTDLQMLFVLVDTETGYFEEFTKDAMAIDNGDKGIYKAYTGATKYFFIDNFLMSSGDDPETSSVEIGQERQQGNANQSQGNQSAQQNKTQQQPGKPDWRKILDGEKKLVEVSGKALPDVRSMMKDQLGELGKYKDMDEIRILEVLSFLNGCVDFFMKPKPQEDPRPAQ